MHLISWPYNVIYYAVIWRIWRISKNNQKWFWFIFIYHVLSSVREQPCLKQKEPKRQGYHRNVQSHWCQSTSVWEYLIWFKRHERTPSHAHVWNLYWTICVECWTVAERMNKSQGYSFLQNHHPQRDGRTELRLNAVCVPMSASDRDAVRWRGKMF